MIDALLSLQQVIDRRRSVRGFRPDPVPQQTLRAIFSTAQRSPSWCNIQPWRVVLTEPATTVRVTAALLHAAKTRLPNPELPFLTDYPAPYREHRRKCGGALYQAMGVERGDGEGRHRAWLRNFACFDAPHLAVVSCDRTLGPYGVLDVGVWLGHLLLAASAVGVDSCAMASVATFPDVLRSELEIDAGQTIIAGIALGYEDKSVPANACRTDRSPLEENLKIK